MIICPECQRAEDERLHPVYTGQLCCYARALMASPKRMRREQSHALRSSLSAPEWTQVNARLDVLKAREKPMASA
jgi:hypothetical protein